MKFKLNRSQTLLLFAPFVVAWYMMIFPRTGSYLRGKDMLIANFLLALNLCVAISYQAYFVLNFSKASNIKNQTFTINALIPAVFFIGYLIYAGYSSFIGNRGSVTTNSHPLQRADLNITGYVVTIFMIYAFVNFFFINNRYLANTIKKIPDHVEQEKLRINFLIPMQWLVKSAIWVFVSGLAISTIADIIKYANLM